MNTITRNGRRRRTVTDCDTYENSCVEAMATGSKSLQIYTCYPGLSLVEWTGCHGGVQAIVARQN